jgi:hypothetical protein
MIMELVSVRHLTLPISLLSLYLLLLCAESFDHFSFYNNLRRRIVEMLWIISSTFHVRRRILKLE